MQNINQWKRTVWLAGPLLLLACGKPTESTSTDQVESLAVNEAAEAVTVTPLSEVPSAPTKIDEKDYTVLDGGLKIYDLTEVVWCLT